MHPDQPSGDSPIMERTPLNAKALNLEAGGWMAGFPPSDDKVVLFTDPDYFSFPKLHWIGKGEALSDKPPGTKMIVCPESLMIAGAKPVRLNIPCKTPKNRQTDSTIRIAADGSTLTEHRL